MSETRAQAVIVRPMLAQDAPAISSLLGEYAKREILLWRSEEEILKHQTDFFVAELDKECVGCVALHDYGDGLWEIRSLAIRENLFGGGIGSRLIQHILTEGRNQGAREVFALTLRVSLFQRNGFTIVPKERFPQKVWKDCQLCRKRDCCDETALTINLRETR